MHILVKTLVGGLVSGLTLAASAMTIDFTEFATDSASLNLGNSFTSKGFVFTEAPTSSVFMVWGKTNTWSADPGGAAIYGQYKQTMRQANGAAFSFYSIDMDDGIAVPKGHMDSYSDIHPIKFTFHYVGGGVSEKIVNLDKIGGLQTFVFGEDNLLSVDWEGTTNASPSIQQQFDNIKVNVNCPLGTQ